MFDSRPRAKKTRRRLLVSVSLGIALAVVVTLPIPGIFFPEKQEPHRADVILVLGPPDQDRLDLAVSLIEAGYSDNLIVSAKSSGRTHNLNLMPICQEPQSFFVHCETSKPFTTQGEIGLLQELAVQNGWTSAMIITFSPHLARTQIYADRCFNGTTTLIAPERVFTFEELVYQYFYQTAALVKARTLTSGCP